MKSFVNISDRDSSNVNSCNKLISEINDIKTQIQSITEFLSSSLPSLSSSSGSIIPSSSSNNRSKQSTIRHQGYSAAVTSVAAARDSDRQQVPVNSRGRIVDGGANLPIDGEPKSSFRSAVLSTIHTELKSINYRASNVVVTGLKPRDDVPDEDLFKGLVCNTSFGLCFLSQDQPHW